jgi:hypothetical protein
MECSMAAHEASGAPVAAGSGGGAMARGRGFGSSGQISEEGFPFQPRSSWVWSVVAGHRYVRYEILNL